MQAVPSGHGFSRIQTESAVYMAFSPHAHLYDSLLFLSFLNCETVLLMTTPVMSADQCLRPAQRAIWEETSHRVFHERRTSLSSVSVLGVCLFP